MGNLALEDLSDRVPELTRLKEELGAILDQLVVKDEKVGSELRDLFLPLARKAADIAESSSGILQNANLENAGAKLQLLKLAEKLTELTENLQSRISPYLSYSDAAARRRADLEKFGRQMSTKFVQGLVDSIGEYFECKERELIDTLRKRFNLKERAKDAFIRSPGKLVLKGIKKAVRIADHNFPVLGKIQDVSEPATFLEQLINEKLGTLEADLSALIEKHLHTFREEWKRKIEGGSPELSLVFSVAGNVSTPSVRPEVDVSVHAVGTGLGVSAAAVAGLAAGWHTLEYALANVFPPAAVITAAIGGVVMLVTQERDLENKIMRIKELVKQVHQEVLQRMLEARIIEAAEKACDQCIEGAMKVLESNLLGNLSLDDYTRLTTKVSHLIGITRFLSDRIKLIALCEEKNHGR